MQTSRLLQATSLRLALVQAMLISLLFLLAGAAVLFVVRRAERQAVNAEIAQEAEDLRDIYARGGPGPLRATIEAHQRDPSIWEFRVEDAHHRRLAGDLPMLDYAASWSTRRLIEGDLANEQSEVVRMFRQPLPGGLDLVVGEDLGAREQADNVLLKAIAGIAAAAAATGAALGALAARQLLARVEAMAEAVDRYGAGALDTRVATPRHAPSDLDHLADALNRMMNRNAELMNGMRQVSTDIAHDLRRPLARHNQMIAEVLQRPPALESYRSALQHAAAEVDEVLWTFRALMHIAELEAGASRLELQRVDLCETACRIVEAYGPMADDGSRRLTFFTDRVDGAASSDAVILAEPRLLGRLLSNLVENALTHTPPGASIVVEVDALSHRVSIADDGPGVPADMRERIFERFVRVETSRTQPGAGLGLALSAAITQALGGRIYAEDAAPGLRVVVDFGRGSGGSFRQGGE